MDYFSDYERAGYNISITRLSDEFLLEMSEHCPGKKWISRLAEWKLGPYFYSHITDYVRFCVLYRFGGLYSDFDAITLGRLDQFPDGFIGRDSARSNGTCDWCAWQRDIYLPPGVMATAKPRHPLVGTALQIGFEGDYDPSVFNSVGPMAVTKAYNRLANKMGFNVLEILEQHVLYPYDYLESYRVFKQRDLIESEGLFERLRHSSLSLHLYGHQTRNMEVEDSSVISVAFQAFSLFQDAMTLSGPEYLAVGLLMEPLPDIRVKVPTNILDQALALEVTVSAQHGLVHIMGLGKDDAETWSGKLTHKAQTAAEMNRQLSRLVYYAKNVPAGRDEITLVLAVNGIYSQSLKIPVYDVEALVTIIVKTVGRMDKVIALAQSVRKYYKTVKIIVADDHEKLFRETEGMSREFYYLPLAYDVGLSAGRNIMVDRVKTEYFLTLDDDFTLDGTSRLGTLIHALEQVPPDESRRFDIAGMPPRRLTHIHRRQDSARPGQLSIRFLRSDIRH